LVRHLGLYRSGAFLLALVWVGRGKAEPKVEDTARYLGFLNSPSSMADFSL
jgi:hypothetical protein